MPGSFYRTRVEWRRAGQPEIEYVVGVTFPNDDGSDRQRILRRCTVGMRVALKREPNNPHDPNAVAIVVESRGQIGYLRRETAEWIAPRLDSRAASFECRLDSVDEVDADPESDEEDGPTVFVARIAMTMFEPVGVERFSFALLLWVVTMRGARLAGAALFTAARSAGPALERMRRFAALAFKQAARVAAVIDSQLLRFAQGSRIFASVYWGIIALLVCLSLAAIVWH